MLPGGGKFASNHCRGGAPGALPGDTVFDGSECRDQDPVFEKRSPWMAGHINPHSYIT